ncbi:MAG: phage tail tip lysozyme [Myxococcales bacterium]
MRGTAAQAIDFFMAKGLTREQAAGIAGNLFHESGFSPNAVGDSGTSFGIAQWHQGRGDAMKSWTQAHGYASNSFKGQLEFLWHELNNSESNALNKLRQTTTAYDAGMSFQRYFERPAQINPARGETAQKYYQESLR